MFLFFQLRPLSLSGFFLWSHFHSSFWWLWNCAWCSTYHTLLKEFLSKMFHCNCNILTFNPAKHAIPKTEEVHIPLVWASLADNMGQGKILQYSHRLMYQKRVTCELQDSYFRLMTSKHAIPRTAEVIHPDGQLWGDIELAIELLYNSVKTESQLVGDQMI